MKYLIAIVTVLSLAGSSCAQKVTFNKGGIESQGYYTQLPYQSINGYLFLNVEIDGVNRKFLFDTGAPTQITSALFRELQPAIINHTEITDASGNKDRLDIINLKEVKLNGLSFKNIPALVSDSDLYACFGIDGVIGSNLLRHSIVRIESGKGLIIITDNQAKLSLNNAQSSPLLAGEPQSYPYVEMDLSGKKKQSVGFDSGSPYLMVMAETHANKNIRELNAEKVTSGFGISSRSLLGVQKSDSVHRVRLASARIAGSQFTNVVVETNKSSKTRVGNKLLNYGNVTLDFIHKLFYFESFEPENNLADKHWSLKPIIVGQKLVAGVVWSELKDQLRPGDQIMAIDEESFETAELCEWLNGKMAFFNSKQKAVLTIKDREGNIKRVDLVKK